MLSRQEAGALRVVDGYRKFLEAQFTKALFQRVNERRRLGQLADAEFGRDFPSAGGGDVDVVSVVFHRLPSFPAEILFVGERPQERVRIKQQPQSPSPFQRRSSSSGKGSKNSGPTLNTPLKRPSGRACPCFGSIATIRATGLRSRPEVIMTSSPSLASFTSLESCVLASNMETSCMGVDLLSKS